MKKLYILLLVISTGAQAQKFDGLALTPPMGWNSWNTFQTKISEQLVKEVADKLVSSGMRDAGYTYLVLDDGWMAMERDPKTGDLVPDPAKFPNGMKALADYVHSKGLKFGLYNCAGTQTCGGYPGTRGYEYQDARFYASVGIDYLKFDWCHTEGITAKEAYTTMSKALRQAGRPVVFSLCEWGDNQPWNWAAGVGHLWRTTGDIYAQFDSVHSYGTWKALGVMTIADKQNVLRAYAGPGHWNDPDMLEVGNGLTPAENRTHFSLWAIMAAPLIAGNDIRSMSPETAAVLTNRELISIDQDALGVQGFRYSSTDSLEVWMRPLQNGDWVAGFVNRSNSIKPVRINWESYAVSDTLSGKKFSPGTVTYRVHNIWAKKDEGNTHQPVQTSIAPHDVLLFRLTK